MGSVASIDVAVICRSPAQSSHRTTPQLRFKFTASPFFARCALHCDERNGKSGCEVPVMSYLCVFA
jgi:hypothetical protein